jgi:hypothetical protein
MKKPKHVVERKEGQRKTDTDTQKYHDEVKKNLEGVTRVTRQEQSRQISGKDCGDSESIKSLEDAIKKDPTIQERIKQMVKKW